MLIVNLSNVLFFSNVEHPKHPFLPLTNFMNIQTYLNFIKMNMKNHSLLILENLVLGYSYLWFIYWIYSCGLYKIDNFIWNGSLFLLHQNTEYSLLCWGEWILTSPTSQCRLRVSVTICCCTNHVFLMILWENKNNRKEKKWKKRKERIDAYFGLLRRLIWLRKQYCLCLPCIQLANFHQLGKKWDKRLSCYKSMEQLGLEGTSESHLIQPPAQAGLLRTSYIGPWSHGFVIPPRRETPITFHDLSSTYATAQSPSQWKIFSGVHREHSVFDLVPIGYSSITGHPVVLKQLF